MLRSCQSTTKVISGYRTVRDTCDRIAMSLSIKMSKLLVCQVDFQTFPKDGVWSSTVARYIDFQTGIHSLWNVKQTNNHKHNHFIASATSMFCFSLVIQRPLRSISNRSTKWLVLLLRRAACPLNCKSCVVDLSSDTTARCTECNDYHRLIDATVNSVAVAGNCYCVYSCQRFFCFHLFALL